MQAWCDKSGMISSILYAVLGFVAWVIATCGPTTTAVWFWQLAKRSRPKWVIHLLLVPCVLVVEWAALMVLSFATGDDGTGGPPGLGFALIPAFFLLIVSPVGYFVVLGATLIERVRRRI